MHRPLYLARMDAGPLAAEILGGLAVGLSLGLIGAGGAILSMPIFVLVLGHPTQVAVVEALVVTGAIALVSAVRAAVAGLVDFRRAAAFALPGLVGAWLGGPIGKMLDDRVQAGLFAALALVAAWRLLARRNEPPTSEEGGATLDGRALALALTVGLAIGVLTSVLGVGGGFLLVPALVLIARVPMKLAVGTSLAVIALNSTVSVASNAYHSPEAIAAASRPAMAIIAVFGVVGSFVGARYSQTLPAQLLRRTFAVVLLLVAVAVIVKSVMS